MKLFAIHAPLGPAVLAGPESARATRTGFSLAALVFGPLWLLARGQWLVLVGYIVLGAVVVGLVSYGGLRPGAAMALFALGHLYLAVEGRALSIAARTWSGRPVVDVVYAGSSLEAEKIHLERALVSEPAASPLGAIRGEDGVIGLFPEPRR